MILTITIARIVRTKGVDMFATTDTLVEMFPHTDGILDMFPHTADIHNGVSGHVETVVQLSKGNISSENVRVEFSLEDMDMSGFQQGATYEQIQQWVQEKYGFHVTHLNIAQVKRKYGIIERENYNKPKSPNSRQPGCPEEKIKAIEAALKHFQMI